jgi:hypothetical protein
MGSHKAQDSAAHQKPSSTVVVCRPLSTHQPPMNPRADSSFADKFSDYPGIGQLNGNLTFVFMPTNFKCDLFT